MLYVFSITHYSRCLLQNKNKYCHSHKYTSFGTFAVQGVQGIFSAQKLEDNIIKSHQQFCTHMTPKMHLITVHSDSYYYYYYRNWQQRLRSHSPVSTSKSIFNPRCACDYKLCTLRRVRHARAQFLVGLRVCVPARRCVCGRFCYSREWLRSAGRCCRGRAKNNACRGTGEYRTSQSRTELLWTRRIGGLADYVRHIDICNAVCVYASDYRIRRVTTHAAKTSRARALPKSTHQYLCVR